MNFEIDRPRTAIIKGLNSKRFFDSSSALSTKIEKKLQKEYRTHYDNYEFYHPETENMKLERKTHHFFLKNLHEKKNSENFEEEIFSEKTKNFENWKNEKNGKKFKISKKSEKSQNSKISKIKKNLANYSLTDDSEDPIKHLKNNVLKYRNFQRAKTQEKNHSKRAKSSHTLQRNNKKLVEQCPNTSIFLFENPKIHLTSKKIEKIENNVKKKN